MKFSDNEIGMRLAKYLKLIADGERIINVSRQVLCEQEDFKPYACFKAIDGNQKQYISGIDICKLFQYARVHTNNRRNGVEASDLECYRIVRNYDSTNSGRLSYSEYFS